MYCLAVFEKPVYGDYIFLVTLLLAPATSAVILSASKMSERK